MQSHPIKAVEMSPGKSKLVTKSHLPKRTKQRYISNKTAVTQNSTRQKEERHWLTLQKDEEKDLQNLRTPTHAHAHTTLTKPNENNNSNNKTTAKNNNNKQKQQQKHGIRDCRL